MPSSKTDRLAPSAAPPSAIRLWADTARIYAEIPGAQPYIVTFPFSEGGLSKALALLATKRPDYGGTPLIHSSRKALGTPLQRAMAEKFLRERGIVK